MVTLANKISDGPMLLSLLDIFNFQRRQFGTPQTAAQEDGERRVVSLTAVTVKVYCPQKTLNIRELQNIAEWSLIFCEGDTFSVDVAWLTTAPSHHKEGSQLKRIIKYEREIVESALKESEGKVSGAQGLLVDWEFHPQLPNPESKHWESTRSGSGPESLSRVYEIP